MKTSVSPSLGGIAWSNSGRDAPATETPRSKFRLTLQRQPGSDRTHGGQRSAVSWRVETCAFGTGFSQLRTSRSAHRFYVRPRDNSEVDRRLCGHGRRHHRRRRLPQSALSRRIRTAGTRTEASPRAHTSTRRACATSSNAPILRSTNIFSCAITFAPKQTSASSTRAPRRPCLASGGTTQMATLTRRPTSFSRSKNE